MVTYAESESFSSLARWFRSKPGWPTEQKRLTRVYVRDITEIQFTSNLDVNHERETPMSMQTEDIERIKPLRNDNKKVHEIKQLILAEIIEGANKKCRSYTMRK